MAYVITQNCCNEASCVAVCPVNCIHPTPDEPGYATAEMLYVDPAVCIDCGACADVCPVDAITADFDLDDKQQRFTELNARYFQDPVHLGYPAIRPKAPAAAQVETTPVTLRVAVIGSGPSGSYAAEELASRKDITVQVDIFERLPTPFGLVRFGVAPDHQKTKSVTKNFTRTLGRKNVGLHLNVEIGQHLSHDDLLEHYHAVIYAVGAPSDRRLDIPGEDLPGSHPATDFVAWYNGHPDHADTRFDLSGDRAVIVGNGNVALDIARILLTDIDDLRKTDIADHALDTIAESSIAEVLVLGRRGPMQAAFTTPELLGLSASQSFDTVVDPEQITLDPVSATLLHQNPHSMPGLKRELLAELATWSRRTPRALDLRFLVSPVEVLGADRVEGLQVARNELRFVDGRVTAVPTADVTTLDCGLVLRSVGHRGHALAGLPFDHTQGVLPQAQGRVVDAAAVPVAGTYTTGWIKRGPSGVIGTNKTCARETVNSLVADFTEGRLRDPVREQDSLATLLACRQPDLLGVSGWEALDRHERKAGRKQRRPRVKVTSVSEMLSVISAAG